LSCAIAESLIEQEAPMPVGLPVDAAAVHKHSTWFIIYGVVLILLGLFAIAVPGIATLAVELMVGWLLLIGGVVGLIAVFQAGRSASGFWWNLFTSIVFILAGLSLLMRPLSGVITLTIILAAYLLAGGIMRIFLALGYRGKLPGAWGWVMFSGLVDIVLGLIIISGMPGTAVWVIGLLVGINMFMMGVAILMVALAVRKSVPAAT
jgi:uncharacterized membrane protein HdeD (DUF308 family)